MYVCKRHQAYIVLADGAPIMAHGHSNKHLMFHSPIDVFRDENACMFHLAYSLCSQPLFSDKPRPRHETKSAIWALEVVAEQSSPTCPPFVNTRRKTRCSLLRMCIHMDDTIRSTAQPLCGRKASPRPPSTGSSTANLWEHTYVLKFCD